jgi:hypothetical protein
MRQCSLVHLYLRRPNGDILPQQLSRKKAKSVL